MSDKLTFEEYLKSKKTVQDLYIGLRRFGLSITVSIIKEGKYTILRFIGDFEPNRISNAFKGKIFSTRAIEDKGYSWYNRSTLYLYLDLLNIDKELITLIESSKETHVLVDEMDSDLISNVDVFQEENLAYNTIKSQISVCNTEFEQKTMALENEYSVKIEMLKQQLETLVNDQVELLSEYSGRNKVKETQKAIVDKLKSDFGLSYNSQGWVNLDLEDKFLSDSLVSLKGGELWQGQ